MKEYTIDAVTTHFNRAEKEINSDKFIKSKRLRSCQAMVYETENYIVLRSYRTFIALIVKNENVCFDVLRTVYGYTSTSNQHICKFKKDYSQYFSSLYKYAWNGALYKLEVF